MCLCMVMAHPKAQPLHVTYSLPLTRPHATFYKSHSFLSKPSIILTHPHSFGFADTSPFLNLDPSLAIPKVSCIKSRHTLNMCSSKTRLNQSVDLISPAVADINGRPVLQPTSNRVPTLEKRHSLKKKTPTPITTKIVSPLSSPSGANKKKNPASLTPPISPISKSPRSPEPKTSGVDKTGQNKSSEKMMTPRSIAKPASSPKKLQDVAMDNPALNFSSSLIVESPGSIAAARKEQVAMMQEQRKMKIAHYGRTKSARLEGKVVPLDSVAAPPEEKRCTFITSNSDPIFVAYHDEEWGVPVHDDKLLFELLVLTGAQVGSNWSSVLKKRQIFRDAFSGFDAEIVASYTEKQILAVTSSCTMDISQVRGVIDNSKRILEIKKAYGSFSKYLWGFLNHRTIISSYKSCHKIPVKTSKSESISKDMVKRGFRLVGPTVIYSLMQAAGLTNDHLITCPRHLQFCAMASSYPPAVAPAL